MAAVPVGRLYCQNNSYANSLETKIVSLADANGCIDVEFEDTVLFPEGGGQPSDRGSVIIGCQKFAVQDVRREGLKAIHSIKAPKSSLAPGQTVELKLDWARRWDHMQQHTGQHLLSALLDKLEIPTLGWGLGPSQCYVELPRALTEAEIAQVSETAAEIIRDSRPITLVDATDAKLDKMPADYDVSEGAVRVISIDGIDENTCCGTHLSTTAHIQALVLLYQIPFRGKNFRLFFIAGQRVLEAASTGVSLQRKICAQLSCLETDITDRIESLNLRIKSQQQQLKSAWSRMAVHDAARLKSRFVLYEQDFDLDYLKLVEREAKGMPGTFALICGGKDRTGAAIMWGPKTDMLSAALKQALPETKGGGKGRWQGKLPSFSVADAEKIQESLKSLLVD